MAGMPKVRGLSPELDKIQERTDGAISASIPDWIASGRELVGVEIDSSAVTRVQHGLGRKPRGWMLQRLVAAAPNVQLAELSSDHVAITFVNGGGNSAVINLWVW